MEYALERDGSDLTVHVRGSLDADSSPALKQAMRETLDGIASITFDLEGLEGISGAGLCILLASYKLMSKRNGRALLVNAQGEALDVLERSGLTAILGIS